MTKDQPTSGSGAQRSIRALLLAGVAAGTAWQGAGADPLTPAPTTGTATGIYRSC